MRPSPHPRSTTTSSFVALATSSILRTTSCGDETKGAQLMLYQTLYSVASVVMIKLFKQLCPGIARDSSIWPVVMINDTRIHELSKPNLTEPVLIQGLPGLGYVGKVAADYFIEKLKPLKIAELYSSYLLFPDGNLGINISDDGTYSLPKYEFYSFNEKQPNAIILTGDAQPSVTGQYEVASMVLDFVERFGCRNVFTMGGYGTRSGNDVGAVYAVVGDQVLGERLKKLGAKIAKGGAVTGAAGVILG